MRGVLKSEFTRWMHCPAPLALTLALLVLTAPLALLDPQPLDGFALFAHGDAAHIGASTGCIAGYTDGNDLVGSAVRTSLSLSLGWLAVGVLLSAQLGSQPFTSGAVRASWARGTPRAAWLVAQTILTALPIMLSFMMSSAVAFLIQAQKLGVSVTSLALLLWMRHAFAAMALIGSACLAALALAHLTRNAGLASALPLLTYAIACFTCGGVLDNASWQLATPMPYLLQICGLATASSGFAPGVAYTMLSCVTSLSVSLCSLRFREV